MKKILQLLLIGIILTASFSINVCFSSGNDTGGPISPPRNIDPWQAIERITNLAFGGLIVVAVVFIIISAYYFIIMGGTEDGPKKGRQMLTWALVGVAIALLARGMVAYLRRFLETGV